MVRSSGAAGSQGGALRTAFRLRELHFHRAKNVITCVSINESSDWLYLGFSDGQLEEHRLEAGATLRCSLSARKAVSKKPLDEIHHLVSARRLAVLSDGAVVLLDCDSLDKSGLPQGFGKGATAVASDHSDSYPSRLAVATKVILTTKKRARLSIFKVRSGGMPDGGSPALLVTSLDLPEESHSLRRLAWAGGGTSMVAATNYRYLLVSLRDGAVTHLFDLPGSSPSIGLGAPTSTPMLAAFPASSTAMLLMEQVGIVVDGTGQPSGGTLAFPSPPLAMAQCGICILALVKGAVTIFDQITAAAVQTLPCSLADEGGGEAWACAAGTMSGSCVAAAGRRRVLLLQPVGLEEQAQELLRRGELEAAQELSAAAGPGGGPAPWRDVCMAEAALILLADLRFSEATEVLSRVPLSLLGPAQLFPMFAEETSAWLLKGVSALPHSRLWGVAQPPQELRASIRAKLGGAPEAEVDAEAEESAVLDAKRAVAAYLTEARERTDGAIGQPQDGIDTLLLRLLVDTSDVAGLERYLEGQTFVSLSVAEPVLEGAGRTHALALLNARHGRPGHALKLWSELATGGRSEGPAGTGAVAEASSRGESKPQAAVAVRHARDLMLRVGPPSSAKAAAEVPVKIVMQFLPWLLEHGAGGEGLEVMCARELPVPDVLALLQGPHAPLRWRYLLHAVRKQGDRDPGRHTELAVLLAGAVLEVGAEAQEAAAWRDDLQAFLAESDLYSVPAVLQKLQGTNLWREQVVLHSKTGNHSAALRLLAIQIRDVKAALKYCDAAGRVGCHLQLLRILLSPGEGKQPLLQEACLLLNSPGGSELDPTEIIEAMSSGLPLADALPTLARVLRERIHRARDRRLVAALERAVHLEVKGELTEAQQERVVVTEERACPTCHTRIGTRMFALLPGGVVQCYRCFQKSEEEGNAVDQQARRPHQWPQGQGR